MADPDLFEPFDRLVTIEVLGKRLEVPENNSLLRCFQYLDLESISYGDFCWNGECLSCQVWIQQGEKQKAVMACRTIVQENMKIVRVSEEISSQVDLSISGSSDRPR